MRKVSERPEGSRTMVPDTTRAPTLTPVFRKRGLDATFPASSVGVR